jgi:DNA-directed RNA polymerase specialized sigma subunit
MLSGPLLGGIMKRRYIQTTVGAYYAKGKLPHISKEEQDVLITYARCGDPDARTRLIESKLGHALSIAKRMPAPNREDVTELALYHLPRCIDSFLRNFHPNLDPYVTFVLPLEIRRSLYKEQRISDKTYQTAWRHKKAGIFDNLNQTVESVACESHDLDLMNVLTSRLTRNVSAQLIVDQTPDFDLRELVERAITRSDDPDESRTILELRISGYTDREVAARLDRSVSYIAARKAALLHSIKMGIK